MFQRFLTALGGFFNSENRKYQMHDLVVILAMLTGIGLEVYVVAFTHGPEHQAFSMTDFSAGVSALLVATGISSWTKSQGYKEEDKGTAINTVADKATAENITGTINSP